MKLNNRAIQGLPLLAAAGFCALAPGQIQPGGYTCSADIQRTHNNSLDITLRTLVCGLPTVMGHWYDLSDDPDLAGWYSTLRCVDWSLWSSSNTGNQTMTIRVYQDTTPESRSPVCPSQGFGVTSEPGPDVASQLLLWEQTTVFPPSTEGVTSTTVPRADGDRSIQFTGPTNGGGGVLLPPDIAFFIEVEHLGEATTRFGANNAGEAGDATNGPEVTWIKSPNCGGGGCTTLAANTVGDWAKWSEFTGANRDFVMQVKLLPGDHTLEFLPFCPTDVTGPQGDRDQRTDIRDLLALLTSWGTSAPPRPLGDVAPLPFGDKQVDVTDLLNMLYFWGFCPGYHPPCIEQAIDRVNEGTYFHELSDFQDGPLRGPTNDINEVLRGTTTCGWFDYGVDALLGLFRYGDQFGIDMTIEPFSEGRDKWFLYEATCTGPVVISTQGDCKPGDIADTMLEVYDGNSCPTDWAELIACDDSSATGCGDHASIELYVEANEGYLIHIGGKFGERGSGVLSIRHQQFGTPDCNNNGNIDAFDICADISDDCNDNLVPDECDIDCNANGVPDNCDISNGDSFDCDANGIPDECDTDCDASGVPDICESQFLVGTGPMSPFGIDGLGQAFLFQDLPEAISDITFSFFVSSDLAGAEQAVDLFIDGYWVTTVFGATGGACTVPGDREDFEYRRALFDILHTLDGNTDALVVLIPVGDVDSNACGGQTFIEVSLKYFIEPTPTDNGATQDCNANGVWDLCDIADGFSPDVQGNGVPDECEP